MKGQSEEFGVVVVVGVLLLGLVLGAVNGALVVVTRVPDIVVTLAMSFVWAGCALLVLKTPGGGAAHVAQGPRHRFARQRVDPQGGGRPRSSSWPSSGSRVRRSRLGLSIYAIGSNQLAAFRSGVSVGRTKIARLRPHGPVRGARRASRLTASTGIGTPVPGPYTLMSVAAVVLGGVSLAGGRGGVFGPIVARRHPPARSGPT